MAYYLEFGYSIKESSAKIFPNLASSLVKTTQWIDVRSGFNMGEKQEVFDKLKWGDTIILKANKELSAGTKLIPVIQNNK